MTDRQILRLIGENVRKARLEANLTQECLAELIDATWQTISYLENGHRPFSVIRFARICQSLNISADRLLEGMQPMAPGRLERVKKVLARKRNPSNA